MHIAQKAIDQLGFLTFLNMNTGSFIKKSSLIKHCFMNFFTDTSRNPKFTILKNISKNIFFYSRYIFIVKYILLG